MYGSKKLNDDDSERTAFRKSEKTISESFDQNEELPSGVSKAQCHFDKPVFSLDDCPDVNNAFLYGDVDEDIYMTIPKGFASKDNKNKENGFVQSNNDHFLFTKSKSNKFIALLIYVDDIVITGNRVDKIDKFKSFLKSKFKIKDLGHLKYFMAIEVIKTGKDLCLSQRNCLELLKDYSLLGCKPVSTPIEPNSVLPYVPTKDDHLLDNITGYQKLLGKLIYLTPDIAYYVHCLAQYMHSLLKSHMNSALNVLRYLKGAPVALYPEKGKKQNTISKSSTEAEYRSLSSAARTAFRKSEKKFKLYYDSNKKKKKLPRPVDLSDVIDFKAISESFYRNEELPAGVYKAQCRFFDKPVFSLDNCPGMDFT
uniref:Reverse transcriptase Ty1/copia-type domain-containing protein n=1 Tax=Tanacetum cinerariifolium TaxID=118510 RepID=A0A699HIS2_TANCI|nr:hypothetical protein [Tanacetum cinerariifolium]